MKSNLYNTYHRADLVRRHLKLLKPTWQQLVSTMFVLSIFYGYAVAGNESSSIKIEPLDTDAVHCHQLHH